MNFISTGWLADHLYQDKPDEQDETAAALEDRQFQARCLGDSAFYHFIYYVEPYEWYMDNGTDYNTAYINMEKQFTELYSEVVADEPDNGKTLKENIRDIKTLKPAIRTWAIEKSCQKCWLVLKSMKTDITGQGIPDAETLRTGTEPDYLCHCQYQYVYAQCG